MTINAIKNNISLNKILFTRAILLQKMIILVFTKYCKLLTNRVIGPVRIYKRMYLYIIITFLRKEIPSVQSICCILIYLIF